MIIQINGKECSFHICFINDRETKADLRALMKISNLILRSFNLEGNQELTTVMYEKRISSREYTFILKPAFALVSINITLSS